MQSTRRLAAAVVTAIAFFALCGGIAYAITGNVFQYSAPKTGYLSLNPMAFAPWQGSTAGDYFISPPDYIKTVTNNCFVTGVNLPDGAEVKSFTFWGASNGNGSVSATLWRSNVATGGKAFLSLLIATDTSLNRISMTGSPPSRQIAIVSNQHFSYGVDVCLDNVDARFYSARIQYTYRDAGD